MKVFLFSLGVFLSAAHARAPDGVIVTGTRVERPTLEVPAAIDRVDAADLRFARPQVNLSESLGRVPGIVVQNRQNYAQDLQITSRGFGARSTFGVRGLRLIADGIPASFPDGQGQVSHFDLGSAGRVEVLRGPFSVMYGNASGGVINLSTERADPGLYGDFSYGDYRTRRSALKYADAAGSVDGVVSASHFFTGGYRDHSSAVREQMNARLGFSPGGATRLTIIANVFASPETQDPLGLTRGQMDADPRQAVANAFAFNTRKSQAQQQLGAALSHRFTDWTMEASVYGGHRDVRQYLAIPLATQNLATHSGGVIDLDRDYGGATLRLTRATSLAGRPFTLTFGGELETMAERRLGFINNNGSMGSTKRDEDDSVTSTGAYAQGEWRFAERWIATGGLRASRVAFRSQDYFIGNGDDSGRKSYRALTPVAGILYRWTPATSVYANYGRGFETPTFAELSYRTTGAGLNFGLQAAKSRHLETGVKSFLGERLRLNAALFSIETENEIAIESNAGGRSTFRNAGRTHRAGLELGASASLPLGFEALLAWTRMEAKFLDSFTSVAGTPAVAVTVPSGSRLPGAPRATLYAELRWRHAPHGFAGALEFLRKSRVWVDDRNSEAADASGVFNLALSLTQQPSFSSARWRLTEYLRVDNLTNRRYAGSVVVNDANLRFYEPAPGRSLTVGVQAKLGF